MLDLVTFFEIYRRNKSVTTAKTTRYACIWGDVVISTIDALDRCGNPIATTVPAVEKTQREATKYV